MSDALLDGLIVLLDGVGSPVSTAPVSRYVAEENARQWSWGTVEDLVVHTATAAMITGSRLSGTARIV